jgi:hypothetical protein
MLSSLWNFLSDSNNQLVLSWLGGGLVVACAGVWAVVKFFSSRPSSARGPSISARDTSVSIGGKVENTKISVAKK